MSGNKEIWRGLKVGDLEEMIRLAFGLPADWPTKDLKEFVKITEKRNDEKDYDMIVVDVPIPARGGKEVNYWEFVVYDNGFVAVRNWVGVIFPFNDAMKVYEIILKNLKVEKNGDFEK